jgi:SH3-like domain-containing protein/ribosomal protein L40E
MKVCYICGTRMPDDTEVCPRCGKIFTARDKEKLEEATRRALSGIDDFSEGDEEIPVSSDTGKLDDFDFEDADKENNDNSISAEDTKIAPNFDKQFSEDNTETKFFKHDSSSSEKLNQINSVESPRSENLPPIEDDFEENHGGENVEPEKNNAKPEYEGSAHIKSGAKKAITAIIVIVLAVLVAVAVYQIGGKIGLWEKTKEPVTEQDTTQTPAAAEETSERQNSNGYYTVSSDSPAPIYSDADRNSTVSASVPSGTVLLVTEVDSGEEYGHITYDEYDGWVELSNLKYTPEAGEEYTGEGKASDFAQSGKYTVNTNGEADELNIRSEASVYSDKVGSVPDGAQVNVTEVKDGWGKISYNGTDGWVSMNYLSQG